MEIGLTYSAKDPRQARARDYLRRFVKETGVHARLVETETDVTSPTVIVNGETLKDLRSEPRPGSARMFPAVEDIARFVDRNLWCI